MMRWMSALLLLPAMLASSSAGVAADSAVASIEPGQWEMRSRDSAEPPLRVCARDIQALVQIRHQGQSCRRFVVEDTAQRTSVTYNCPRTGHGHTVIRVETPRLVQIDSQGVSEGYPFALDMEGRRVGACPPQTAHK